MTCTILKNYISQFEQNKVAIIKHWLNNEEVFSLLKKYNIELKFFVKEYAIHVLNYYISIVKEEREIGDCPAIDDLITFLKEKNLTTSELFILCSGFKNSLIEYTYDLKITNLQIEKEINYIFEKNFAGLLDKYSKTINDIEERLTESSNIINKYVIISRTDIEGKIISVSDAFCDISGYSRKELVGRTHSILRHPDMEDKVYEELWTTIKSGEAWVGELKNLKKDGGFYWVELRISPYFDSKGNILYYDAIRQDVSSKKELEEQQNILIEQSKSAAMGEMISMIAHQWRQPLQAVSILTQKLPITKMMDGDISEELLEQVVDDISMQLEYMSKTIDDFRDFFLPDKPKELIDIESLVNKALEFISFMTKKDSVEIDIISNTNRKINVHVNELVQVIINIIKNARDILIEKNIANKKITISFYEKDDFVCLDIEDNASGVPEEIIERIFEPYFSTKEDKNGTGLGLYMSKTIIEKHCLGNLTVKNSEEGAIFRIKLPIS